MSVPRLLSVAYLSLLLSLCAAQERVLIGELEGEAHDVSGTVYALNSRTLEIENFNYDGQGPAAVYWVDTRDTATKDGYLVPEAGSCSFVQRLAASNDAKVRLELPNDFTLTNIGYFSIWCEEVGVSFGGIRIDVNSLQSALPEVERQCRSDGTQAAQRILVGELSTEEHEVSGTVYALNDRTLEIDSFNYDGRGPAAVYWIDRGTEPTREGVIAPDLSSCEIITRLPQVRDETVRIELPSDLTLSDIGYFSIWCEAVGVSFGGIRVDVNALPETPAPAQPQCSGNPPAFPVREGYSCKSLSPSYQVRWQLGSDSETINIELVAVLEENMYMGFGVSGSDQGTEMVGSDVAIAFKLGENYSAVDYHMSARSSCSDGEGVCPDEMRTGNGTDHITNVEGESEGRVRRISYTRPITAIDADLDRPIRTDGPTFISWATGPLDNETVLPRFHGRMRDVTFPSEDVEINFNLKAQNDCTALVSDSVEEEEPRAKPFERPVFSDVTNFTARIGPSGGARGVTALKEVAWGIAWYMSPEGSEGKDVLIPAIGVERGKTYRFKVYGGDSGVSSFHPLYITSNPRGAYVNVAPEDRLNETVYAGIEVTVGNSSGIFEFSPTAVGALCEFKTDVEDTTDIKSYEEYYRSLDTSCTQNETISNNAGELVWTVEPNTPDVVYYQCVTHELLGFEIRVFDEGQVDVDALRLVSSGSPERAGNCTVTVNNEELTFKACTEIDRSSEFNVFWNIVGDEIETVIRARTPGYAGFGWGYNEMVPGNAVIVYRTQDDSADIDDYQLSGRSSSGVQPGTNQRLTKAFAFVDGGFVVGRFTRKLNVSRLPTIPTDGETSVIWSIGARPDSKTTLTQHSTRGTATINVSQGVSSASGGGTSAFFIVHGAFMGVSWLVFVPIAIIVMRYFKKYNPIAFQIHRALNGTSVVLVIAAYFMGIARGNRVERAHLIIGSILFSFTVLQGLGGLLRPKKGSPARGPWFFAHAFTGSIAFSLGVTNVFLGIAAITNRGDNATTWYIIAGVVVGIVIITHIVLSAFPARFPVRYDENASDMEELQNLSEEAPAAVDSTI
ncbi:unnamed protein product [Agarophyton chilense]|eukprot:gb/GEZJ01001216.1/.p1 GENE.gb/GEZJ01001216.1/~~gb/GEZJ01001216.1/.p1  ORF type:complete len:1071 (-),score=138.36 gb/GEZJ01001216.1/:5023-8235(-)